MAIKAILPTKSRSAAKNMSGTKELVNYYKLLGINVVDGKPVVKELVDCRVWMGRSRSASTAYASVWVKNQDDWTSGYGSAGGYGYHKSSAAIAEAIRTAGIELKGCAHRDDGDPERAADIGGAGETAIRAALQAIGQAMGYDAGNLTLVEG